jgi:hypothetical protein
MTCLPAETAWGACAPVHFLDRACLVGYAGFGFDGSGLSPGLGFGLSPESVIVSPFGAKHGLSQGEFAIR